MTNIEEMNLESKDLVSDRLEKLQDLLLGASSKSDIDFDKLCILLGDEVDEGLERYAFTWPDKTDTIRQSQTVSTATLHPCLEESHNRDGEDDSFGSNNIYIEGNNLEVLKLLRRGCHDKVKMICIDPPYNTDHGFVCKDGFDDTTENYKEQAGLTGQSNVETSGRYHSDWCSMMHLRLKLARELLSDDGIILTSINDNENRNLRILCDEVFGEPNFVAQLIWERAFSPKNDAKFVSNSHDYVLVYTKSIEHFMIGRLPRTETTNVRYMDPDNDPCRPWVSDNMTVKTYSESTDYPITTPFGRVVGPPARRCWRPSRNAFRGRFQDNRIWFSADGNGVLRIKRFLCGVDGRGMTPTFLSFYKEVEHSQEGARELVSLFDDKSYFDGPRPTRLLQRLITLASLSDSDTVLDFFSGSASMTHSVFKQEIERGTGYHFVLVQLPEGTNPKREAYKDGYATLCDISEERIRRAGDKIKPDLDKSSRQLMLGEESKQSPGIGLRVFTLDDSGAKKSQLGKLMHEVAKPDRTELDIVFEMMLKWGLELALPVEKPDATDYPVWSVACDELVCYMFPGLTIETPEAIADMEPKRVLIPNSILNDTFKLSTVQIFKHASECTGTDIRLGTV